MAGTVGFALPVAVFSAGTHEICRQWPKNPPVAPGLRSLPLQAVSLKGVETPELLSA
jgi:hypothetical protein